MQHLTAASRISIHAPTRGATKKATDYLSIWFISIHAPTRGATCHQVNALHKDMNFNPRSYKRSDNCSQAQISKLAISIHAPTRGATQNW